ncbi:hypothetical protein CPB86DRAFT_671196, partial [Serendipita vermifera]
LHYRELSYPLAQEDLHALRQMRLASGTYYDRIPTWLSELESGHRLMWFVYLTKTTSSNAMAHHHHHHHQQPPTPALTTASSRSINPSDPSLASINTNRFELTSLWIYPAYRALRLNSTSTSSTIGTTIIGEMERQAALRGAEYVTFNTTAGANQTLKTFERIGYREYKPREHRYSITDVVNVGLPGSVESTLAAFFEK